MTGEENPEVGLPPVRPLVRLTRLHVSMVAGEAIMAVALADSMFLSISPTDARPKVILFLLLSFLPFTVVARYIGPVVGSFRGGQRAVLFGVAVMRAVLMIGMVTSIKSLALFPLAFGALVLSKTYSISKSATVPQVVSGDQALVEANSGLARSAGIIGFVVGVPAYLLQMVSTTVALYTGAAVFLVGAWQAWKLPGTEAVAEADPDLADAELHSAAIVRAATAMRVLRGVAGFMFFLLAFWLRGETAGTAWFGLAIAMGNMATLGANWVAPGIRARMSTESMLSGSLLVVAVAGIISGVSGVFIMGIILTSFVNAACAIGRVAFEATVQSGAPDASKTSAFARFETQNQLAWVAGGLVPVVLKLNGHSGSWVVGLAGAAGFAVMLRARLRSRDGRATGRGPSAH